MNYTVYNLGNYCIEYVRARGYCEIFSPFFSPSPISPAYIIPLISSLAHMSHRKHSSRNRELRRAILYTLVDSFFSF